MSLCVYGGQKIACRGCFSSSFAWVPGIELTSLGFEVNICTLSYHCLLNPSSGSREVCMPTVISATLMETALFIPELGSERDGRSRDTAQRDEGLQYLRA